MSESVVKLYVNKALLVPKRRYVPLAYLLLGNFDDPNTPWTSAAWKSHGYSGKFFQFVDHISEAHYVLLPYDYYAATMVWRDTYDCVVAEARAAGKPLLANNTGDIPGPILHNGIVLRAGGYAFLPRPDVVVVPYPVEDLAEVYCNGAVVLRAKADIPVVSFVGWAEISFWQRMRIYFLEIPIRLKALVWKRYRTLEKGVFWRQRALRSLSRTSGIKTAVIGRRSFGARLDVAQDMYVWRKEFVDSLKECDYALCIKGDENSSFRFYEALSMGRIPVLLDTECVLPLAEYIDYRSFCLIVPYQDVDRLGEYITQFHSAVSEDEFVAMQRRAREAFVRYLRMDSYSEYLAKVLLARAVWRPLPHISPDQGLGNLQSLMR